MRATGLVVLALALAGCATVVSGPQDVPDGTYVVSVLSPGLSLSVIDGVDEALAEARFKCASTGGQLSVLSQRVARTGSLGGARKAEVRFSCVSGQNV